MVISASRNFVKRTGDIMSGPLTVPNNQGLKGKDTTGTSKDLIEMNESNQVEIGGTTNINIVPNTLRISTNNVSLEGLESNGAVRNLIKINTVNETEIGNAVRVNNFPRDIRISTNNRSFQGVEAGGGQVNLFKINASDQIEYGNVTNLNVIPNTLRMNANNKSLEGIETGSTARNLIKMNATNQVEIGASANENIMPSTLKLTTNNVGLQGVQTDGTTFRNLIKVNDFNNVEAGSISRPFYISSSLTPQFNSGIGIFEMFHTGYVQPQARVTHSVLQAITTATNTVLAFDTERWDTNTFHDNVTNNSRLTATTKGLYQIIFNGEWAANATGIRQISLRLNGTTIIASEQRDATTSAMRMSVSTQYQLSATDFVEVLVHQTSGGNLDITKNANISPEFSISFVSPTP